MRALLPLASILLGSCDPVDDFDPLVGGDTCISLADGTWTFTGPAWGMGDEPMDGELQMDAEACSFAFSDFSMAMDDLPSGGVLDEAAVQLDGLTSYWRSCTGTAADEHHASGTCTEDGAAWEIAFADEGDTDTDADDDTDADTDPGDCAALDAGSDWAWSGPCPGMETPCELAYADCTLTLSYGSMTMGMPYSAIVVETEVTFADDNTVDGCVGAISSPDRISGSCDGGCAFVLSR